MESQGLALEIFAVNQFDCTNEGRFNFSNYLTDKEMHLFGKWCKSNPEKNDWSGIREWNPDAYERVRRQHRLETIKKFNPDNEIDKTVSVGYRIAAGNLMTRA